MADAEQQVLLHLWQHRDRWLAAPAGPERKGIIAGMTRSAYLDWMRNDGSIVMAVQVPRSKWAAHKEFVDKLSERNTSHAFSIDAAINDNGISMVDYLPLPQAEPHWAIGLVEADKVIVRLRGLLNEKQNLALTYILSGLNLKETGVMLGVSESRVSQLFTAIMEKAKWLGARLESMTAVLPPIKPVEVREIKVKPVKRRSKYATPEERLEAKRRNARAATARCRAKKKAAKQGWYIQQPIEEDKHE